jgi:integrase
MSKQRNPNGLGNYRKLADGRVAWRQTKDGGTRELSAKTMSELKQKVKMVADLPIITEKYKVEEWFERWLENFIKPLKKKATYEQYNFIYQGHIKPVIGHRKMSSIKTIDVQSVITAMNNKVYEKKDKDGKVIEKKVGTSTKTMKHAKTVMNGAFSRAVIDKVIAENPVKNIDIPEKQAKPRKTLTTSELSLLFKQLQNSRWIWSVRFLLVTGLRRGELLALRWSDIDFENKRIVIDESNSSTGLGDTKSAKVHYVVLSDLAIQYLNGQKLQLQKETNPILFNEELRKTDLIFPNNKGEMIRPDSYLKVIARAAKKSGIKASPHCLRHTFVYHMRNKLTLKELQEMLGHDESTTTLDIYGNMLNESNEKVAKDIDDVFGNLEAEVEEIENKKSGKVIQFKRKKA